MEALRQYSDAASGSNTKESWESFNPAYQHVIFKLESIDHISNMNHLAIILT